MLELPSFRRASRKQFHVPLGGSTKDGGLARRGGPVSKQRTLQTLEASQRNVLL